MNLSALSEAQQDRVRRLMDGVPFARLIGLQLESVEPGRATLKFEVREELKQNDGIVHGGAIASLIDTAMAFAIIPHLEADETSTTVDLTIHYLRSLSRGTASATAQVVRAGRRVVVVSAEVLDHDGLPAATAISTYLRLKKKS